MFQIDINLITTYKVHITHVQLYNDEIMFLGN